MGRRIKDILLYTVSAFVGGALVLIVLLIWLRGEITDSTYWATTFTAIAAVATFMAAVVALLVGLKNELLRLLYPVEMDIEWSEREPFLQRLDSQKCTHVTHTTSAYTRLKITNIGKRPASNVYIQIESIHHRSNRGDWLTNDSIQDAWLPLSGFVPISLKWTHFTSSRIELFPQGTSRYLDLGSWKGPKQGDSSVNFTFAMEVIPQLRWDVIPPNQYKIELAIICNEGIAYRAEWQLNVEEGIYQYTKSNDPVVTLKLLRFTS